MKILNLDIDNIKPYGKNPRINDYAVEKVAESIKRYGFKVPLVIDKNNVIVAGHTRYSACKLLGITEIPCVVADDLSDEEIKQYRLVDNKVAEYATWDYSLLNMELSELDDLTDFDFPDFSIQDDQTPEELDVLLDDHIQASPNKNRDKPREPQIEPPRIPDAVIQEELPAEDEFDTVSVEVLCKDEEQERILYDFLNSHGFIYQMKSIF